MPSLALRSVPRGGSSGTMAGSESELETESDHELSRRGVADINGGIATTGKENELITYGEETDVTH